jgi:hypothetical protein
MGPSRGFKERLESVKAGATATASGAVAMVPISALDENSGGDPLVICYIAMVAMVAMALIESSMIFPANRRNLHFWGGIFHGYVSHTQMVSTGSLCCSELGKHHFMTC